MTDKAAPKSTDHKLSLRELVEAMIADGLIEKADTANLLLPARGDRGEVHGAGGADDRACPASLALLSLFLVGRSHFTRVSATEEVDRPASHHLVTDPRA